MNCSRQGRPPQTWSTSVYWHMPQCIFRARIAPRLTGLASTMTCMVSVEGALDRLVNESVSEWADCLIVSCSRGPFHVYSLWVQEVAVWLKKKSGKRIVHRSVPFLGDSVLHSVLRRRCMRWLQRRLWNSHCSHCCCVFSKKKMFSNALHLLYTKDKDVVTEVSDSGESMVLLMRFQSWVCCVSSQSDVSWESYDALSQVTVPANDILLRRQCCTV